MNRLVLAVAGGRKTQSIVDHCVEAANGQRILVVTYTQANQRELVNRLALNRPLAATVEVQGWFSFLLGHCVKPYLPRLFPGRRLRGLNFDGDPGRFAKNDARFLDSESRAYKRHLAHLALNTNEASSCAVIDRLARIYDEIHIDEVQDLNGYDLEMLLGLMKSPIDMCLVGDVRQALVLTNAQDPKNKQYKGSKILDWFKLQASRGLLEISYRGTTWRSNQAIADFADTIFPAAWGFGRTTSENSLLTGHDGIFAVSKEHVASYVAMFRPLCLRHSVSSATDLDLDFMNFGVAKGLGVDRVLIAPTGPMLQFLKNGATLSNAGACSLYVGVTRARASVGFVVECPETLGLPVWVPSPGGPGRLVASSSGPEERSRAVPIFSGL